ncbi:MAG: hypothetical protein KDD44_05535, partial [Bdellovibrionales bacterium]|nr:hypothetical protein [Bdellovibrionales bacterium]
MRSPTRPLQKPTSLYLLFAVLSVAAIAVPAAADPAPRGTGGLTAATRNNSTPPDSVSNEAPQVVDYANDVVAAGDARVATGAPTLAERVRDLPENATAAAQSASDALGRGGKAVADSLNDLRAAPSKTGWVRERVSNRANAMKEGVRNAGKRTAEAAG